MIFVKVLGYFKETSKVNFNYEFKSMSHGTTHIPINPKAPICVCHNMNDICLKIGYIAEETDIAFMETSLNVAGPYYIIIYEATQKLDGVDALYWCVVHPDEHERMERILNGTDNPLYDLVHELRYNPNMPTHLGVERKEAQEDFEQKKKQKRELE